MNPNQMKILRTMFCGILLVSASCVWEIKEDPKPLHLTLAASQPDTVTIQPQIHCVFSSPVQDAAVSLEFSPDFFDFYVQLNADKDTLTIVVTHPLNGNTRYAIRPMENITSRDGATLAPNEDSLVIITAPAEHEPNNSVVTADTVTGRICGMISNAADTDYYRCDWLAGDTVCITSSGSPASFQVIDSTGFAVYAPHRGLITDSLIAPAAFISPFTIKVFAGALSTGGLYDLRRKPALP
jgi:hypothetical protein